MPDVFSVNLTKNFINSSLEYGSMENQVVFRVNDNNVGPELLTNVFLERGWVTYDPQQHGKDGWQLWWRTTRFRTGEYAGLLPWQRINHFPSCSAITRKDALCRNFRKMRIVHGNNVFNFSPQAYNMPNDYTKFVSEYARNRNTSLKRGVLRVLSGRDRDRFQKEVQSLKTTPSDEVYEQHPQIYQRRQQEQLQKQQQEEMPLMWICKPAESSRGRGIFIFENLSELQYDCNAVVQQYITDPFLIGGYKFDIRIYVTVLSFNPMQIYIHEEGLVRFSTEKYDLSRPDNVFAHLTNTSINKFSPGYTTDKDEVGHGCKWTISQLRRYFLQNNVSDDLLWHKITDIVILTILIQAPSAPKLTNCFELYGFDILVDAKLKPWLLEVNLGPALSSDCQADMLSKKSMLHDLFDLVFADSSSKEDSGEMDGLGLGRDCLLGEETSVRPMSSSANTKKFAGHNIDHVETNKRDSERYSTLDTQDKCKSSELNGKHCRAPPDRSAGKPPHPKSELDTSKSGVLNENCSRLTSAGGLVDDNEDDNELFLPAIDRLGRRLSRDSEDSDEICLKSNRTKTKLGCKELCKDSNRSFHNDDHQTEIDVHLVESKTSSISDSGLSSLSNTSEEVVDNATSLDPTPRKDKMPVHPRRFSATHRDKCKTPCYVENSMNDTDLMEFGMNFPNRQTCNDETSPDDGILTDKFKVVHGNMRQIGSKRIVVHPADDNDNTHSYRRTSINKVPNGRNQNGNDCVVKQSTPLMRRKSLASTHATKLKSASSTIYSSPRTLLNTAKSTNSSRRHNQPQLQDRHRRPEHGDDTLPGMYGVPRNLSRAEALRFQHFYNHHQNSRYMHVNNSNNNHKQGHTASNINNHCNHKTLTHIPKQKVGRFYLVFPFNETTQKSSHGMIDPKSIIKELQRRYKNKVKSSSVDLDGCKARENSSEDETFIWAPIRN